MNVVEIGTGSIRARRALTPHCAKGSRSSALTVLFFEYRDLLSEYWARPREPLNGFIPLACGCSGGVPVIYVL